MVALLDLRERGGRLEPTKLEIDPATAETVREILQRVFVEGDEVLIELAAKFDGVELADGGILVSDEEFDLATRETPAELRASLDELVERLRGLATRQTPQEWWHERGRDWAAENHEKNGGTDGYAYADQAECVNVRAFAWFRSNPEAPDPAEEWARLTTRSETERYKRCERHRYVLATRDDYIAWFVPAGKTRRKWAKGRTLDDLSAWLDAHDQDGGEVGPSDA